MIAEMIKKVKEYLGTKEGKRNAVIGGIVLAILSYFLYKKYKENKTVIK